MQKNMRVVIIGTVLIGALLVGAYWMQQYLQRSRASATAPTLSLSIPGEVLKPGDFFDVLLSINPNLTPFYSFDVAFTYDPAKVDFQETDPANILSNIRPLSTTDTDLVDVVLVKGAGSTSIDTAAHTVRITGIRASGASDPFIGRDPLEMVRIGFIMKEGVELPLAFKWIDPEPGKITTSDSFEKKDLLYTGIEPTGTSGPTAIPPVGVLTNTPNPTIVQPTSAYNSLTPIPTVIGGNGAIGTTTEITPRKDLLYINSIASYQSPYRYEQAMKLESGSYTLKIGAKLYVKRGRGMVLAFFCNDTTCGTKKKGDAVYTSPVFPLKSEFSELTGTVSIPEEKSYLMRVFCEDGSECEIDYISLEDAWGSERVLNSQFGTVTQINDPRKQPISWEMDATANLYGSVDSAFGKNGALMINNSIK